jgi:hypothetical protein
MNKPVHRDPTARSVVSLRLIGVLVFVLNLAIVPLVDARDVLDSSLIVRLNFDAAPVGDVIVDTSPAGGHPGTNNLATWVASENGRTGVMFFDGTVTNQITVEASSALDSTVGTIAFWMESTNVTALPNPDAILFDRRTFAGDVIYQAPSGQLGNQAFDDASDVVNSQTTAANPTDGQWHHVAYVYDQSSCGTISFYVDGLLDTSAVNLDGWLWDSRQEFEIGRSHDPWWAGYTGFLDDFRFYNRMLSANEVADVAGLGTNVQIVIQTGGQPQDVSVAVNDTPSFAVKAIVLNGNTAQLAYQWQENNTNIVGATNASYSLRAAATDNGAEFQVLLSYPGASNVTSAQVTLTVVPEVDVIYSFDSAPTNDVIVDSSTNTTSPHNGVNNGATWVDSQDGRQGVMYFDGTMTNRITLAPAPELNSTRGTIAFWMESSNVTQVPNPYAIVVDRRSSIGDVIYQTPDGNLSDQIWATNGISCSVSTTANPTDGTWHHVAYLYDQTAGGFICFYLDGVLNASQTNSLPWAWDPQEEIEIGSSHDPWWAGYSGYLDEFRMYNRVLTPAEIAQLAGLGSQPTIRITSQPANLVIGAGDQATFVVGATVINGDAAQIAYVWQQNGTNVPGATNAAYSFTVAAADDGASFQALLSYAGATNVASAVVTLGVLPEFVVHYAFAAPPQNDVIVDSSPVGTDNGVNVGATWVASQDRRTNVMSFDPTVPSQITIAAAPTLNSMRGTIAFWMESSNVTQTPNPYALVVDRRSSIGDVIYQVPSGNLCDQIWAISSIDCSLPTSVNPTDGKWHHVAYLYDQTAGGFISFYVDGVLNVGQTNSQPWAWDPQEEIEIGTSHDPWWASYGGYLGDFRIYNRVLSASEIAQLAGLAIAPPTLQITVAGGKLTLGWSGAGFVLQQNSSLTNPAGWADVPNGDVSPVKLAVPAAGAGFYRLKGL